MPNDPKATDVHPDVVLDAREGFITWFEDTQPDADDMFKYLVGNDYVTLKFFVELASRYGA